MGFQFGMWKIPSSQQSFPHHQPQVKPAMHPLGQPSNHNLLDTDEESQCLNEFIEPPPPPPWSPPFRKRGFVDQGLVFGRTSTSFSTPDIDDSGSSLSLSQRDPPLSSFQEDEEGEASILAPSLTVLKKSFSDTFLRAKSWKKQLMIPGLFCVVSTLIAIFLKLASDQAETSLRQKAFDNQANLLHTLWRSRLKETVETSGTLWEDLFDLSPSTSSMVVVVSNSCADGALTFQIDQLKALFVGIGDFHDSELSKYGRSFELSNHTEVSDASSYMCGNTLSIYPTQEAVDFFSTNQAYINMVTFSAFAGIIIVYFVCHDWFRRKQIDRVTKHFHQAQEIVSSFFPANVQERVFQMRTEPSVRLEEMMLATPKTQHKWSSQEKPQDARMEGSPSFHYQTPPASPKEPFDLAKEVELANQVLGTPSQKLQMFLSPPQLDAGVSEKIKCVRNEPIADLFPDATVMFADIAGFTAWSSEREPAQVFRLLETIFHSFDKLANKYNVFKVETIGDSYMAVTGLPDPQPEHAKIMVKFADECLSKMNELTRKLELILGPGTAELRMRFGVHSGPVTAGVLRGEKSRFQLFGDTVNMASRMESTGRKNRIQVSQATADHLIAAGLENWLHPRSDLVYAKGKGDVRAFWLNRPSTSSRSLGNFATDGSSELNLKKQNSSSSLIDLKSKRKQSKLLSFQPNEDESTIICSPLNERRAKLNASIHPNNKWNQISEKYDTAREQLALEEAISGEFSDVGRQLRLIDWNSEILLKLLKKIIAARNFRGSKRGCDEVDLKVYSERNYLEEVQEIIPLLSEEDMFTENWMDIESLTNLDIYSIELPPKVERQLKEFVSTIACMYRNNSFHNFEHASHVLMNSLKMLNRVISADQLLLRTDYTRAISSDPLTQFAIVFAALIHDVDHTGVTNAQLVKEQAHVATLYNNKSVAEQNSLDLAWGLLMEPSYEDLRTCIFSTEAELERFRQLIVNVILATDIFDPDMKALRNSRFDKAFHMESKATSLTPENELNLKATIVIEYIMQASDVSHTMQHWHIYKKWNERLFAEMYSAWQVGRLGFNPATGWFQGELSFFDNYVIPLAKKLEDCQVFGAAGNELLKFALENRKEWDKKGKDLVESYIQKYTTDQGD